MKNLYFIMMRSMPLLINGVVLIYYLISNNSFYLRFFYILTASGFINHALKTLVFKPLMGNKKYPIIGKGSRPANARNCGLFYKKNAKLSTSYGMPSGHTQFAGVFSTIGGLKIYNSNYEFAIKVFGYLCFISFIFMMAHSRVFIKCHTVQQTIMGGLIGIFIGYKSYEYALKN